MRGEGREPKSDIVAPGGGRTASSSGGARATAGERRQATALFCDLVDSVSLSTGMDPEDLSHVMGAYLEACYGVIGRHGGHVVQDMGDGVLAYFGFPKADEDAAANAVAAALALPAAIRALDLRIADTLHVRVGVATGLVVIRDRRPVGAAPNLAARLQAMAPIDGVLVSGDTQSLTRGLFAYRPLGEHALKGFPERVRVCQAMSANGAASGLHRTARAEGAPLVGRDGEMAALRGHWASARDGQGGVVVLRGEAGVGKSRLVEALRAHAALSGAAEMMWYCGPSHATTPLYPVVQQIVRAAGFRGDDAPAARRQKLALLLDRFGDSNDDDRRPFETMLGVEDPERRADPPADPDARKATALAALIEMMDLFRGEGSALFVLEDAHWSDPTTLELLDRAAGLAAQRPWLILVTARPDGALAWSGGGAVSEMRLEPLVAAEAMRLCACLDPERRLPPEAAREIVERSDGIPLFVEEVTRSALEALLDGISPAAIPMSLHDALIARLDRLGPAYEVARLAAVIGRRFERSLLAAIAGLDAKDLDRALGILTAAGLVESGAVGAYRFRHVLIRDAAYESLLKSDRQAIHGKVARAILERFPAMRETEPDRIARHLALGGEISEAVQFWTMASEFARASGAWREAVALVEGALELIGDQPAGAAKARLRQQLERSVAGLRGLPRSAVRRSLDELWSSRLSLGEDADRFHVAFDVVNGAAMAGEIDLSVVAARLCVETAERSGDVPRRIDAYLYSGFALVLAGDLPVARRHLEQALGLYRRHEGARLSFPSMTDQLTFCLGLLLLLYHAAGEDGNAERAGLDLKAHLRDFGEPAAQILGREYLAIYALCNDAPADVRALMEEAIAVSRRNQFSDWENIDQFYMALAVAALSGRLEDAEAAERRLQTLRDFMLHNYTVHGLNEIARLRLAAGDAAGALRCIETAIAEAERMGEGLFLSPAHRTKAEILAATPGAEPAEARAALRAAIDIARAQGAEGFARRAEAFVQADRTRRCFDSPDTKINMSPRAISDHSAS